MQYAFESALHQQHCVNGMICQQAPGYSTIAQEETDVSAVSLQEREERTNPMDVAVSIADTRQFPYENLTIHEGMVRW
jgi:hypothetical protein